MNQQPQEFDNLLQISKLGENKCKEHLALIRWPNGAECPYCDSCKVYTTKTRYKCAQCRRMFSVTAGTIFHDSKLPLTTWFYAIYLLTSHKKGISSLQLHRDLGITQKSAWFVLQRLRFAMRTQSFKAPLEGTVELDETYHGGKERNKHANKRSEQSQGRSLGTKAVVFGMIERGGEVRTQVVPNAKSKTLTPIILANVRKRSRLFTDEYNVYSKLGEHYKHKTVNHSIGEYFDNWVHTNCIENFWSLFKRGIIGIYHMASHKHLNKYLDEFEFRFNSRDITEGQRVNLFLSRVSGILPYKALIS